MAVYVSTRNVVAGRKLAVATCQECGHRWPLHRLYADCPGCHEPANVVEDGQEYVDQESW